MTDPRNGGVYISPERIYDLLLVVRDDVRDVKKDLDAVRKMTVEDIQFLKETVSEHARQIDSLRTRTLAYPASLAAGIIGLIASVLAVLFHFTL